MNWPSVETKIAIDRDSSSDPPVYSSFHPFLFKSAYPFRLRDVHFFFLSLEMKGRALTLLSSEGKWHVSFETCGRQVKEHVKAELVQRPSYSLAAEGFPSGEGRNKTGKSPNLCF